MIVFNSHTDALEARASLICPQVNSFSEICRLLPVISKSQTFLKESLVNQSYNLVHYTYRASELQKGCMVVSRHFEDDYGETDMPNLV